MGRRPRTRHHPPGGVREGCERVRGCGGGEDTGCGHHRQRREAPARRRVNEARPGRQGDGGGAAPEARPSAAATRTPRRRTGGSGGTRPGRPGSPLGDQRRPTPSRVGGGGTQEHPPQSSGRPRTPCRPGAVPPGAPDASPSQVAPPPRQRAPTARGGRRPAWRGPAQRALPAAFRPRWRADVTRLHRSRDDICS